MVSTDEACTAQHFAPAEPSSSSGADVLRGRAADTLMSGLRREVRGGAVQAHCCVVTGAHDVQEVMGALREASSFKGVVSWSYAYRLRLPEACRDDSLLSEQFQDICEDGLDEGCGERILAVLRRFSLHGLLVVVSRWQQYGSSSGLELLGIELYSVVTERVKDIITELQRYVGLGAEPAGGGALTQLPPEKPRRMKEHDFGSLPQLPEPRAPSRYTPNHYLADAPGMNRPASLPNIFTGGDPRQWMDNDRCLREFPESELWALRSLRQPDPRIERVLLAVAELRGQRIRYTSGTPAARWGHCRETVLRSATLRTELLLLDAGSISMGAAQRASSLLEGLEVADVRRSNVAVGALLEWARGVVQWRLQGPPGDPFGGGLAAVQPRQAVLPKMRQAKALSCSGTVGWPKPSPIRGGAGPPRKRPAVMQTIA